MFYKREVKIAKDRNNLNNEKRQDLFSFCQSSVQWPKTIVTCLSLAKIKVMIISSARETSIQLVGE